MQNIHYDYARMESFQREAGLRRAQLSGVAFEPRRKQRRLGWPWARPAQQAGEARGRIIPAS